jgi:predicted transcriptional regulator
MRKWRRRVALIWRLTPSRISERKSEGREVSRDYKRVHDDVQALSAASLIERGEHGAPLVAPYDTIKTTIAL